MRLTVLLEVKLLLVQVTHLLLLLLFNFSLLCADLRSVAEAKIHLSI